MRASTVAAALAWLFLLGCSSAPAPAQPLRVVATVAPIADWTKEVGRERVDVALIVPVGVDPQTYEPTDEQREQITTADVVVLNGLGLEPWLDEILAEGRTGQIVVELSQFVAPPIESDLAPTPTASTLDAPQATPAPAPARPAARREISPYGWLDPRSAVQQIDIIARTLTRADGAGFTTYRQNAARYAGDVENLDTRIERAVAAWPEQEVRSTDRFLYPFAQRYELRLALPDDKGAFDPSGAPVFHNRFAAERTVAPAATNVVTLNPLGSSTYDELMQTLLLSMTDALQDTRGSSE